jgi:transcriptional regulator with XRE-family HTH domain
MNSDVLMKNLIFLRKQNDYTQKDLADELNYSDKVISKWERGESVPDLEALINIASFYNLTIDKLVTIDLSNEEKTETFSNKIDYKILKGPSKLLKSSIWLALFLYVILMYFEFSSGSFLFLLLANIGFLIYFIIYSWLLQEVIFIAHYKGHEIKVLTNIWKVEMHIDQIIVDEVYNAFKPNVRLTGRVEDQKIKANISIFLNVKLSLFFE